MRLIQAVKFPLSVLIAETETGGNPYEMLDVLTDAVVEEIGKPGFTETGKLSCGARVGDPRTGRVVFVQAFGENAKIVNMNLRKGDVIHATGERRQWNGATTFRLIELLEEAPKVENGRFVGAKREPVTDADLIPAAVEGEQA